MIGSEAPRALLRFFFSAVIVSDRGVPPPPQQARRGGRSLETSYGTRSPILSLLSMAGLRLSRPGALPELRRSSQCRARAAYAGGGSGGRMAGSGRHPEQQAAACGHMHIFVRRQNDLPDWIVPAGVNDLQVSKTVGSAG